MGQDYPFLAQASPSLPKASLLSDLSRCEQRRASEAVQKWNYCCSVAKLCPTLLQPHGLNPKALLSMGFSRQEYWSRLPSPPPGDLPNLGTAPSSAWAGGFFNAEPAGKPMQKWNKGIFLHEHELCTRGALYG